MTNKNINQKIVKEVNKIFHDEEASLYDSRHTEPLRKAAKQWKSVLNSLDSRTNWKNMQIVDMGTGTCFVPLILSEYVDASNIFICTDISKKMLAIAREKLKLSSHHKTSFINCDLVSCQPSSVG